MNGFRVNFNAASGELWLYFGHFMHIWNGCKKPGQFYTTELRYGETINLAVMINNLLVSNLRMEDRNEV